MEDEIIESAKATQEVAKTGGKAIDITRELGGFLSRMFGDVPTDLVGLAGGDWLHIKRQERLLVLAQKTNQQLKERGIENSVKVPLSFGVPLLEKASLEEDDGLMNMWANLLAMAMDPGSENKPHRAFVQILANLEPVDAKLLEFLSRQGWELFKVQHHPQGRNLKEGHGPQGFTVERLSESTGLSEKVVRLALSNLYHEGCMISEMQPTWDDPSTSGIHIHEKEAIFRPSDLGFALIEACMPNQPEE